MVNVFCILGTRPEAIKMAPVIIALKKEPAFVCTVLSSAQHREMLDQVLEHIGITPDIDLDSMQHKQSLNELCGGMLAKLGKVLEDKKPDIVLAQGDTTTVLASALAAFHCRIPFGHIEAGLRTGNPLNPFPEEMNRILVSRIAAWHFAPTERAKQNLLREGVSEDKVFVTGNTVIDMVRLASNKTISSIFPTDESKKIILVTCHRRESHGKPIHEICRVLKKIADTHKDIQIIFPVHPNPNIKPVVMDSLQNHSQIILCQPMDYMSFISLMKKSILIMTDSGGIQEEATALKVPVLLMRDETERPEGIESGLVTLIGKTYEKMYEQAEMALLNPFNPSKELQTSCPFGDGYAAEHITEILKKIFFQTMSSAVMVSL